tara:strand:+ start:409 stop:672 length:264 start_codon:yes stop_codon:yes gene_type:complete
MKVTPEDYTNGRANDPDVIGIYVRVQYNDHETEQHFLVEDCCDEVGRVTGNLISQFGQIPSGAESQPLISGDTIGKLRSMWRAVIRA